MKAVVYQGNGQIGMEERPVPHILDERDAGFLITHRCGLDQIMEAYDIFENKKDHVIKFAIKP